MSGEKCFENFENLNIMRYEHHGEKVFVKEDQLGMHREHCLCWECGEFYPEPEDMDQNCPIARVLFNLCVLLNIVTPVWECPNWTPPRANQLDEKEE